LSDSGVSEELDVTFLGDLQEDSVYPEEVRLVEASLGDLMRVVLQELEEERWNDSGDLRKGVDE
jgi:hypothetical protein